ncbi:MAG: hypothetical protein ACO3ZK_16220, partial [Rubrivivax sp.]
KAPAAAPRGLRAAGPPARDAMTRRGEPLPRRAGPSSSGSASSPAQIPAPGATAARDETERAGWVESSVCLAAGLVVIESTDLTAWLLARRLQHPPGPVSSPGR